MPRMSGRTGGAAAPGRVLVKAVNWLGDVVMSLPALRAVRRACPDARLAVLIKAELASFFDGARWIDEVIPYRVGTGLAGLADRRRIVQEIRARRFDLAVVFPRSVASALWVALAGVPRRVGFSAQARGWLLTDRARLPNEVAARHQAEWYLHLVGTLLGASGSRDDVAPDVHEPHRARMRAWLAAHRRRPDAPLIALAPAAAYGPAKEWPAAHWTALIDALAARDGTECVLVGAPAERPRCAEIAAASGALVAAGETSVGELLALLSLCNAFAGNDSGSMHVAAALGLPTVGLFGSTNPDRTSPLGPRTRVIYRAIECSPCLQRTCRFGHTRCLTEIAPAQVAAALAALRH
jgi:heptosyltransferase-2